MSQTQAIRRRKQALKNYMHMAPQDRPHYKRRSVATATARLQRLIQREKERNQRKGMKK